MATPICAFRASSSNIFVAVFVTGGGAGGAASAASVHDALVDVR